MLTVESQDELLRLARGFVQREDWPKAWLTLNKALNDDPDRPETLYLIGHVLRQQGHPGVALPLFAKALSKHQKQPNLWMNYGACMHDLNRHDDAVKAFEVVRAMLPNDPMPPANIAGSLVNMGKWNDAINAADTALKLDPSNSGTMELESCRPEAAGLATGLPPFRVGLAEQRALYRAKQLIRLSEERLVKSHQRALVHGASHTYIGQEAVAAGVCAHLRLEDVVFSTHRGHGHALAKGLEPRQLMAELYGRRTGCSRGRGGSMHLFAPEVGLLGTSGIVALFRELRIAGPVDLKSGPKSLAAVIRSPRGEVVFG